MGSIDSAVTAPPAHTRARPAGPFAKGVAGPVLVVLTVLVLVGLRLGVPTGQGRVGGRFEQGLTWALLSDLAGLVALALLAWVIVLSTRLRPLERLFGGLDRLYRWHHLLGGLVVGLAAAHPFALMLHGAGRWSDAGLGLLWFDQGWAVAFGQIALYIMVPLLAVTFVARMHHETFVWVQRVLGLVMLPAALHAVTVGGAVARSVPLRIAVVVVAAAGLTAYVGHTLLGRLLVRRLPYRVLGVRQLAPDLVELALAPEAEPQRFDPGQFAFLTFARPSGIQPHPFSIASAPEEDHLRFVIKAVGDHTRRMSAVAAGGRVRLEGPYGGFSYRYWPHRRQIWVAGGIGVAPFLSMARSLRPGDPPVLLYYCVRHRGEAVFADELRQIERNCPAFSLRVLAEDIDGPPTAALVNPDGAEADAEILLCGPRVMIRALRGELTARGTPASCIHYEDFEYM